MAFKIEYLFDTFLIYTYTKYDTRKFIVGDGLFNIVL